MHYQRLAKRGSVGGASSLRRPRIGTCSIDGCERAIKAMGRCKTHYERFCRDGFDTIKIAPRRLRRSNRSTCSVDGCTVRARHNGMCQRHYSRLITYGDALFIPARLRIGYPGERLTVDREMLAWAAGFFDGEGGTYMKSARRKDGTRSFSPTMHVAQTTLPVLEKFQQATTGMGKIYGPRIFDDQRRKPVWSWQVSNYECVVQVLCLLWPWLGDVKRDQGTEVLRRYLAGQSDRRRSLAGYELGNRR